MSFKIQHACIHTISRQILDLLHITLIEVMHFFTQNKLSFKHMDLNFTPLNAS